MTKTKRNTTETVAEAFHRHYSQIWGEERWRSSLYPALAQPTRYACLVNRYAHSEELQAQLKHPEARTEVLKLPKTGDHEAANCFVRRSAKNEQDAEAGDVVKTIETEFPPPQPSKNGLLTHWNLDVASVLAASLLSAQPGDIILDLCASPGGKSIVLSQSLWPHLHSTPQGVHTEAAKSTYLHSNEADGRRQRRLADNLKAYVPKSLFDHEQVSALKIDGTSPKAQYELRVKLPDGKSVAYDKILVDAPCSSERHIIHAHEKAVASRKIAEEMASWRPGSSKRLAQTQLELLMTALRVVRTGGTVLYATCSIEPTENDGVIEKMLAQVEKERKKGVKWAVKVGFDAGAGRSELEDDLEKNWAERTKYGWIVLPDHPSGGRWGPLFFCILTKIAG